MGIAGKTEHKTLHFTLDTKENGIRTMAFNWDAAGHATGVWVRYNQETSHKRAFSMLVQGVWEAMQDPDSFNIEQDHRGEPDMPPYWDGIG